MMDYQYDSSEEWETLDDHTQGKYDEPRFDAYGESTQCVIANLNLLLVTRDTNQATQRLDHGRKGGSVGTEDTFTTAKHCIPLDYSSLHGMH
jgi:hypothetical protein